MEADTKAQRMFAESGDLGRSALASMNIGGVLATQGDINGAKHSIERALTVFRKQGDQSRVASALSNLGSMYEIEGDPHCKQRGRHRPMNKRCGDIHAGPACSPPPVSGRFDSPVKRWARLSKKM